MLDFNLWCTACRDAIMTKRKIILYLWSMEKQIISLLQSLETCNLKISLFKLMGLEQSSWFVIHTWSHMKSMDLVSLLTEVVVEVSIAAAGRENFQEEKRLHIYLLACGLCYQFDDVSSCLPCHSISLTPIHHHYARTSLVALCKIQRYHRLCHHIYQTWKINFIEQCSPIPMTNFAPTTNFTFWA